MLIAKEREGVAKQKKGAVLKEREMVNSKIPSMDIGKRLILFLFLVLSCGLIGVSLWPSCWLVLTFAPQTSTPFHWVLLILGAILVFNYVYILAVLAFRLIIPRPKEGFFPIQSDGKLPRQALILMLNVLLTKMLYHTPWASLFTTTLTNIFPLAHIFRRLFGPDTPSVTMGGTVYFLDPYLIEAGKNVQFGFGCLIVAHSFDNRGLMVRKVKIGDHVLIGGQSSILPGVEIGHHSIIATCSVVYPGTIVGPYEYWAGNPAKKIKNLENNA